MPKYACSYAYDVSCYKDFVVEAADETEAQAKIDDAVNSGQLKNITAAVCWENGSHDERAFVQELATEEFCVGDPTLEDLIQQSANA